MKKKQVKQISLVLFITDYIKEGTDNLSRYNVLSYGHDKESLYNMAILYETQQQFCTILLLFFKE